MSDHITQQARRALAGGLAATLLSLAGCGGGGGDSGAPAPAPSPAPAPTQSLSGVVIDGPIQGATVCLDTNNNSTCDSGEPASAATDAQGHFTISGLTSTQISGTALIADIPATAIDADHPGVAVGVAYKLRAPAGKGAVISPVTHLIQTGIVQGKTLAQAEAAVAAQLQVAAASLYNNYVGATSGDNGSLATIAATLVTAIQSGATIDIFTPATSEASYSVRVFNYANADNYFLRYYYSTNVPDSAGQYTYYDLRKQLSAGAPVATSTLYDSALVASAQGWFAFDGNTPNSNSSGSPFRSTFNRGYTYIGTRTDIDVGGMPMGQAIAMAEEVGTINTIATVTGVNTGALTGTMPAGAKLRRYVQTNLTTPVMYRESDGFVGNSVTTLAGLVAAFPVPATPTALNTASMAGLHGNAGCGQTVCTQERLRVAFGAANAATYYLCDIDTSTGSQTNCGAIGTGTYANGTAVDGVTPIMTFAGLPAATSIQTFTRVFVQRNGHVYFGFQDKLVHSTQTRLTRAAFEALAAQLNITPPTVAPSTSAYAGTWSASYMGGDTGSCASITIDVNGAISGGCTSTGVGGSFSVAGTVSGNGSATFTASGGTTSGAVFSGTFTPTTASGTWTWTSSSGTWTATKH
ncbi:MAG TPA: hypothetical protein VF169_06095 [Albitalea sp.]|uniref:hypothetical protein n=1 Tax=Piscinibacter sp. TaxID=1903157 RepID=UPI002ED201F8